jgi:hypothetical protein
MMMFDCCLIITSVLMEVTVGGCYSSLSIPKEQCYCVFPSIIYYHFLMATFLLEPV